MACGAALNEQQLAGRSALARRWISQLFAAIHRLDDDHLPLTAGLVPQNEPPMAVFNCVTPPPLKVDSFCKDRPSMLDAYPPERSIHGSNDEVPGPANE